MPARIWRHGIHSFLELLRIRLPASLDHMLAFIYLAYSMMTLLYETAGDLKNLKTTWLECLGDLARYRMAIEDVRQSHLYSIKDFNMSRMMLGIKKCGLESLDIGIL